MAQNALRFNPAGVQRWASAVSTIREMGVLWVPCLHRPCGPSRGSGTDGDVVEFTRDAEERTAFCASSIVRMLTPMRCKHGTPIDSVTFDSLLNLARFEQNGGLRPTATGAASRCAVASFSTSRATSQLFGVVSAGRRPPFTVRTAAPVEPHGRCSLVRRGCWKAGYSAGASSSIDGAASSDVAAASSAAVTTVASVHDDWMRCCRPVVVT